MKKLLEKYKVIIVVAIVLWSAYCINTTFKLIITERHIKQLEEKVANQEAVIDTLMDDNVEAFHHIYELEGK